MVSLIWLILYFFGVCGFSWWVVLIESVTTFIVALFKAQKSDNDLTNIIATILLGPIYFAFMKLFCGLTISAWCIIISPIYSIIALIVPGGFIGTEFAFEHFGLIAQTPLWTLIFAGILDVIFFFVLVFIIVEAISDRKENR